MKFKKPLFWDLKKPNFISNLLYPLTIIIKVSNFLLYLKNKNKRKEIKTICVGNIYVGGTGKTPTTIKLYEVLKKIGFNVSTAKKFYKYQFDENSILENKSNLILGNNRKKIIHEAIAKKKDFLIFDDGLQDKKVNYDLQFVCFDSKKWVGNGRLIPAGPLRENLQSLKKYDGVFLKNENENENYFQIVDLIKSINPKIEIFFTKYKPINLDQFKTDDNFLIFSGIGNPDSFKNLLKTYNFKIVKEITFPDHYKYTKKDIEKIKISADSHNAKIITTQKDYVKIKDFNIYDIKFLEIDLEFEEKEKLTSFIKRKINE
tara:strand:- start:508 stop:1458 length:951 start_codon:yes stop_codon:yes gene_type:complete